MATDLHNFDALDAAEVLPVPARHERVSGVCDWADIQPFSSTKAQRRALYRCRQPKDFVKALDVKEASSLIAMNVAVIKRQAAQIDPSAGRSAGEH